MLCYPAEKDPDTIKDLEPFDLELVHDYVKGCEQEEAVMVFKQPHGAGV